MMKVLLVFLALLIVGPARAAPWQVSIDTTPLVGRAGFLAFTLLGGAPPQVNTLTVTGYAGDGALGSGSASGKVTGSLTAGPLVLMTATNFFNEWLQSITFGTTLSFRFDLSDSYAGGTPDNFSLYLLDDALLPFPTTDPSTADAALSFDVVGPLGAPRVFDSNQFTVSATPVVVAVPIPATLALAIWPLLAVLLLSGWRGRRATG
jgi:hypothetical protein